MSIASCVKYWVLLVVGLAVPVAAQQAAEPVYVPMMIKVKGSLDSYVNPNTAKITASLDGDPIPTDVEGTFGSNNALNFPAQILPIEMGRESSLTISSTNSYASSFTITPPPGYTVLINGLVRKTKNVSGSGVFKIRILPALDSTVAPAGTATGFTAGQVKWGVSLGSEKNGNSIGWMWMIGSGVSDWDTFFKPTNLYFEQDSDELTVHKITVNHINNIKRQVRTNEAFVDLIDADTPAEDNVPALSSGAKFEIRFYHPKNMTTSGSLRRPLPNKQPFLIYRVIDGYDSEAPTKKSIKIQKQVCALEDSPTPVVLRTEETTLTREGTSSTNYTWTATDWTLLGEAPLASSVAVWTEISGLTDAHREVAEIRDLANGGAVVARTETDHVAPFAGHARMPVSSTAAPTAADAVTSSVAYYADALTNGNPDPAKRYRRGFPQISSSTGGAWSAVTYVDPDNRVPSIPNGDKDEWLGLVDTTFGPWLDTTAPTLAANSTPTIGTGIIATRLDYTKDVFGYPSRVTLTETYRDSVAASNLISKRTTAYSGISQNGRTSVLAESKDYYGTGENDYLSSSRIYFREDDPYSFWRSQVNTEVAPTGAKVSYIRQRGVSTQSSDPWAPIDFNPNAPSPDSRIIVITGAENSSAETESSPMTGYEGFNIKDTYLLPGRSTLAITYRDDYARIQRTESYLRTLSSTWQLVAWENFTYNDRNQLTLRTASNGDTHELFYEVVLNGATYDGGEYLTREVDAAGVETSYIYDKAGRMWKSIRSGYDGAPDIISETIYDAADRVVQTRVYAAGGENLAFVTERSYDLAGRVTSERSSGSPAVTTAYNPGARTTTITNTATGATKISETYLDGQPKRVSGTSVVEQRYAYSIGSDSRRRTDVTSGPAGSVRTVTSWADMLGRSLSSAKPAPPGTLPTPGSIVFSQTAYSPVTGLPIKGTSISSAPTITTYDAVGEPKLAGLDADNSEFLEPGSAKDRITGTRKSAIYSDSAWWSTSETYTYSTAGSSTETVLGKTWTRLTGLTGGLVGETRSWDVEGNLTRRTVERNRNDRKITTRMWFPGILAPQVDIAVDGLATESAAPDGLITTTTYDALRRPSVTTTPRSGAAGGDRAVTTTYQTDGLGTEATNQVWKVTDAEDRTTTYEKDDVARTVTTTNPDGKAVVQKANLRGQVTHVYGAATSPVRYVYDDYGQRIEQHTFRSTSAAYADVGDFPSETASETDRVVWEYDGATGLLLKKTDPLGRFVSYDYDLSGRIAKRYWARVLADGTTLLAATPSYDPATGDLLETSYNDGGVTPTVSTTYDRLGRPLTITDATGTRTFVRDTTKPWRTNAEQLPAFYGSGRQLSWLYEESSGTSGGSGFVLGRSKGFRLGTSAQPDALLEQTFSRSDTGLLTGVSSTHSAASTRNFTYGYTPNSRLVGTLTAAGTGYSLSRQWDPVRDLLTRIETKSGVNTLAAYDYTHTVLGQRETATQAGEAFAAAATDPAQTTTTYAYNERGEVESALTGVGNTSTAPAALIPGRKFAFRYDLAGNRVKSSHQNDISDVDEQPNGPATSKYIVGKGNQLTQRDNPVASVSGVIGDTTAVMAVDQSPLTAADRQGHHWQRDVVSPEASPQTVEPDGGNSTTAVDEYPRSSRTLVTLASLLGAGSGGTDLTAFDRRLLVMNPRDEQFRYDRDGNLLRDGTWDYTWDAENRLVRMETHWWLTDQERKLLEFTYDYQGRRVSKRVQLMPVGTTVYLPATETRYLYDGWNLIAEFETTSSTPFALRRSYTWGLDLIGSLTASGGVGALMQITDHVDGQSYLPGYDGNGNVAVLVRASDGFRAAAYEYGPYGEVLRSEGTYAAQNTFRLSTKFTDLESGLVYYGMRYYDARNGRFINRDPIEERGGLNLYGFCGNNGVNRYDVLGMSWLSDAFKKIKRWVKKNTGVLSAAIPFISPFINKDWKQMASYAAIGVALLLQQYWVVGFSGWAAFGASVATGAASGAIAASPYGSSAMLQGAIFGGIAGGAAWGIGSAAQHAVQNKILTSGQAFGLRIGAHGLVGGGLSAARGGRFSTGFYSSAAATALEISPAAGDKFGNIALKTAWSAGVGGSVSRISGGSFSEGAQQGALQYILNSAAHAMARSMGAPSSASQALSAQAVVNNKNTLSQVDRDFMEFIAPFGLEVSFTEGLMSQSYEMNTWGVEREMGFTTSLGAEASGMLTYKIPSFLSGETSYKLSATGGAILAGGIDFNMAVTRIPLIQNKYFEFGMRVHYPTSAKIKVGVGLGLSGGIDGAFSKNLTEAYPW